jgi:hypothetical protein
MPVNIDIAPFKLDIDELIADYAKVILPNSPRVLCAY